MTSKAGVEISKMRLTIEQRLESLERDIVVLQDTMKLLHKLLRQQRELINDYITQKVTSVANSDEQSERSVRPEDALYTFICRRRFDNIERQIKKIRKIVENSRLGLKAG